MKLGQRSLALNIDSISDNHRGNYTCEASNAAGVARYSAVLNVNGTSFETLNHLLLVLLF